MFGGGNASDLIWKGSSVSLETAVYLMFPSNRSLGYLACNCANACSKVVGGGGLDCVRFSSSAKSSHLQ